MSCNEMTELLKPSSSDVNHKAIAVDRSIWFKITIFKPIQSKLQDDKAHFAIAGGPSSQSPGIGSAVDQSTIRTSYPAMTTERPRSCLRIGWTQGGAFDPCAVSRFESNVFPIVWPIGGHHHRYHCVCGKLQLIILGNPRIALH